MTLNRAIVVALAAVGVLAPFFFPLALLIGGIAKALER